MTELTQSLASAPTEVKVSEPKAKTNPHAVPTFSELIYAHYAWYKELRGDGVTEETQKRYDQLRTAFQRKHGQIVRSYWCSHVESAVVLTEREDRFGGARCGFHRETHWATRDQPDIANAPPIRGRNPPRKNAYGLPTSKSRTNFPELIRWTTLTTAPIAPAISAATGVAQVTESQIVATIDSTTTTDAIPAK